MVCFNTLPPRHCFRGSRTTIINNNFFGGPAFRPMPVWRPPVFCYGGYWGNNFCNIATTFAATSLFVNGITNLLKS